MRQQGNSFFKKAERQRRRWCVAVAREPNGKKRHTESSCRGTYLCRRFRFFRNNVITRSRDHEKLLTH